MIDEKKLEWEIRTRPGMDGNVQLEVLNIIGRQPRVLSGLDQFEAWCKAQAREAELGRKKARETAFLEMLNKISELKKIEVRGRDL